MLRRADQRVECPLQPLMQPHHTPKSQVSAQNLVRMNRCQLTPNKILTAESIGVSIFFRRFSYARKKALRSSSLIGPCDGKMVAALFKALVSSVIVDILTKVKFSPNDSSDVFRVERKEGGIRAALLSVHRGYTRPFTTQSKWVSVPFHKKRA